MNRRQFITALAAALGATVIPGVDEPSSWRMAFNLGDDVVLTHIFLPGNEPLDTLVIEPAILINRSQNWAVVVEDDCFSLMVGSYCYLSMHIDDTVSRIGARYLRHNGESWFPVYRIVDVV